MTVIEIKQLSSDEIESSRHLMQYAFAPSPKPLEKREKDYFKDDLRLGLFKNKVMVAIAMSVPHTHSVRGKIFEMAGIAGVTTLPEAKRKGYARQLVFELLDKENKSGKPFTVLYPFKQSFYGRMGYVTLPQARFTIFSPKGITSILKLDIGGYVKKFTIGSLEGFDFQEQVLNRIQTMNHGMSLKRPLARESIKENNNSWLAIAFDNDNKAIGSLQYKMEGFHKPLKADYLHYKNENAKFLLLQWLANHVDQVNEIHLMLKPTDLIENWFFDLDPKIYSRDWVPSPMGRVLNVERISGMEIGEGDVTIHIEDDFCLWNTGTYNFKRLNGKLEVKKLDDAKNKNFLSIHGLSALVYGGYDPDEFQFRNWGIFNQETSIKLKNMFPNALAHIFETF